MRPATTSARSTSAEERTLVPRTLWTFLAAGFLAIGLSAGSAEAATPIGSFDGASCDGLAGWAQDPDEPDKAIDVHLYFGGPAGTPGVPAAPINANVYRDDLCTAIGSCAHGFVSLTPLSLEDGQPRDVYAYGIDSMGGPNPALGATPKTLQCPPAAAGVRRRIADVPTFDTWAFSSFWDLLPLGSAEADALADGPDLPSAPELVKPDDGTDAFWLVDGGLRRPVTAAVAATWRFDLGAAKATPKTDIDALLEGPAVRPRPVLFVRGGLYLVDDPLPEGQGSAGASSSSASAGVGGSDGSGGGTSATTGGAAPADAGASDGGCAISAPAGGSRLSPWVLAALLAFAARRRRAGIP